MAEKRKSYGERSKIAVNTLAKALFELMERKKTNLCLAADVMTKEELLKIADELGPYICMLKTHVDIISDFDQSLVVELRKLADKHDFILFEDRKFADIGNTVLHQYTGGVYKIVEWAEAVTAHGNCGEGLIKALGEASEKYTSSRPRGVFIIGELSAIGADEADRNKSRSVAIQFSKNLPNVVAGIVAQQRIPDFEHCILAVPGINLSQTSDRLGQQFASPQNAIIERGADVVIVGRGIYHAENPIESAKEYQRVSWEAYLTSLLQNSRGF